MPESLQIDITIAVSEHGSPQHRIEMEYRGVSRLEAMRQPALAAAILLFEASEPLASRLSGYPLDTHPAGTEGAPSRPSRRFHRWTIKRQVEVAREYGSKEEPIYGETIVMSEGGMCVALSTELREGQLVDIKIPAPTGPEIRVRGAVRNRNGREHGIEFFALSESERRRLISAVV